MAILDIGTTRIRVLVGEAREDQTLSVLGMAEEPSRGVRKGSVVDFDTALACIRAALHRAEEQSDVSIREAYLMLAGSHIMCTPNEGSIPILSPDQEIHEEDVDAVGQAARTVNLGEDRQIMHTLNRYYGVDGQTGIVSPVGMEGSKLTLSVLIVHGIASRIRNAVKLVRSVPLEVRDVAFSGLCAGLSVLTPRQKDSGVLVMDLGGGTTDLVGYADRNFAVAESVGIGGDHLSNDLALGLKLPLYQAERLKMEHGNALHDFSARGQTISIPAEGGFPAQLIKKENVHLILNARAEELFELVRDRMESRGLLSRFGAGVVLTGGGAQLRNIDKVAEKVFNMPCLIGRPVGVAGLGIGSEGPSLAAPTGMLKYAQSVERRRDDGFSLANLWKSIFPRSG